MSIIKTTRIANLDKRDPIQDADSFMVLTPEGELERVTYDEFAASIGHNLGATGEGGYFDKITDLEEGLATLNDDKLTLLENKIGVLNDDKLPYLQAQLNQLNDTKLPLLQDNLDSLNDEKLPGLEVALDELNSQKLPRLENDIYTLNQTKLPALDGRLATLEDTKLPLLQDNLDSLNDEKLPGLDSRLASLEDTKLPDLQGNLGTLDQQLQTLSGNIGDLGQYTGTLTQKLNAVDDHLDTLDVNIGDLSGYQSTLTNYLDGLDSNLSGVQTDLNGLRGELGDTGQYAGTLAAKLNSVDLAAETNEQNLQTLSGNIGDLAGYATTLTSYLDGLEGDIAGKLADTPGVITETYIGDNEIGVGKLRVNNIFANTAVLNTITAQQGFYDDLVASGLWANTATFNSAFTDKLVATSAFVNSLAAKQAFFDSVISNDFTSTSATIRNAWFDHIVSDSGHFNSVISNKVEADTITGLNGFFNNLTANSAFVDTLAGKQAFFDEVTGNSAFISTITAQQGFYDDLVASGLWANTATFNSAFTDKLVATSAFVNSLAAKQAFFDEVTGNNAFIDAITARQGFFDDLASSTLWGNVATFNDAFVDTITANDALVENLTASDVWASTLTAGDAFFEAISSEALWADKITANYIGARTLTSNEINVSELIASSVFANAFVANEGYVGELIANDVFADKITSNEVNVAQLIGSSAWLNEIIANNAYIDEIITNNLWADKLTANEIGVASLSALSANIGQVTAGQLKNAAGNYLLDLNNSLLTVSDQQTTPQQRIKMGKLGTGVEDWGLEIYDQNGKAILLADGLGTNVVGEDNIVDGAITVEKVTFSFFDGDTPADDIIATINADPTNNSLAINGSKITINGATTFASGYDPSTKAEADDLNDYVKATVYNPAINDLQAQIDGQIESYFQDHDPAATNEPAVNWDTTTIKEQHKNDTFTNSDTGKSWRWVYDSTNGWHWMMITDTATQKALQKALQAQDTADYKRRTFVETPTPPYQIGDLWVQGENGDLLRSTANKGENDSYNSNDWIKATKYIDQQYANQKAAQEASDALSTAKNYTDTSVDGKITTYYQATQPDGKQGDLWIDTGSGNVLRRFNGTAWKQVQDEAIQQALTDASNAQSTADKKIVSYYQPDQPTASSQGDLWFDTDDDNHPYWWNGTNWVDARDGKIATALDKASQAIQDASSAQSTADGKVTTFYDASTPSADGTGDLWINLSDNKALYRWDGASWEKVQDQQIGKALQDAASAQSTADKKIVSFYQDIQPTGASIGDLWYKTDNNNEPHYYNGTTWISVRDGNIAQASQSASNAQTTANNALSNAQQAQATADGAIRTYYQTSEPTGLNNTTDIGDLWFDTDSNKAHRWDGANWIDIENTNIQEALNQAQSAQTTADGKITSYYQTSEPPSGNTGDLWYDTSDGNKPYYWDSTQWVSLRDATIATAQQDATDALENAATAKAIADGKVTTFYQDSTPAADGEGDLWIDTDDNNQLKRWSGSGWIEVENQRIQQALANAQSAQTTADGKIESYYASSAPTASGVGDLWYDIDDDNKPYYWNGSEWISVRDATIKQAQIDATQALQDAASAQTTADGKITTFYQPLAPITVNTGDLWIDTDNDNKLKRWDGTGWVDVQDKDIQQALTNAQNAQTTADGKIVSFYQPEEPSAKAIGDLWFDTDDQNKPHYWDGTSWVSIRDKRIETISQAANQAQTKANNALTAAQSAQATADGAIRTYYQTSEPTGLNNTTDIGDLWFDTTNNQAHRWNGTSFKLIKDNSIAEALAAAQSAQTTADGKVTSFYQDSEPTGAESGDLWYDTNNDNKPYYYTGSQWVTVRDQYIDKAGNQAERAAKNKLANTLGYPNGYDSIPDVLGDTLISVKDGLGYLNTDLIRTGVIKSGNDNLIFNLDTGRIEANTFGISANNILIDSEANRAKFGDTTNYIDWNAGTLTGVFDDLQFSANTFDLTTAGGMAIDSSSGIDLGGGDYWHDDNSFRFGGPSGFSWSGVPGEPRILGGDTEVHGTLKGVDGYFEGQVGVGKDSNVVMDSRGSIPSLSSSDRVLQQTYNDQSNVLIEETGTVDAILSEEFTLNDDTYPLIYNFDLDISANSSDPTELNVTVQLELLDSTGQIIGRIYLFNQELYSGERGRSTPEFKNGNFSKKIRDKYVDVYAAESVRFRVTCYSYLNEATFSITNINFEQYPAKIAITNSNIYARISPEVVNILGSGTGGHYNITGGGAGGGASSWGGLDNKPFNSLSSDFDVTSGVASITNPFDPSGNYSNLRAQATTKADVGLGNVDDYGQVHYDNRYYKAGDSPNFSSLLLGGSDGVGLSYTNFANNNVDLLFGRKYSYDEEFVTYGRVENRGRFNWHESMRVGGSLDVNGYIKRDGHTVWDEGNLPNPIQTTDAAWKPNNWNAAYDERGSQIAGAGLSWADGDLSVNTNRGIRNVGNNIGHEKEYTSSLDTSGLSVASKISSDAYGHLNQATSRSLENPIKALVGGSTTYFQQVGRDDHVSFSGAQINGQTVNAGGSFTVGGTNDTYYPVQFKVGSHYGTSTTSVLQVGRGDTHENENENGNGSGFQGTFFFEVQFTPHGYGNFKNSRFGYIKYRSDNNNDHFSKPVGKIVDGSGSGQNDIIIWLKGGATYHWNAPNSMKPWTLANANPTGTSITDSSGDSLAPITAKTDFIASIENKTYWDHDLRANGAAIIEDTLTVNDQSLFTKGNEQLLSTDANVEFNKGTFYGDGYFAGNLDVKGYIKRDGHTVWDERNLGNPTNEGQNVLTLDAGNGYRYASFGGDLDNVKRSTAFYAGGATNRPFGTNSHVLSLFVNDVYGVQIGAPASIEESFGHRKLINGTWSNWIKHWTESDFDNPFPNGGDQPLGAGDSPTFASMTLNSSLLLDLGSSSDDKKITLRNKTYNGFPNTYQWRIGGGGADARMVWTEFDGNEILDIRNNEVIIGERLTVEAPSTFNDTLTADTILTDTLKTNKFKYDEIQAAGGRVAVTDGAVVVEVLGGNQLRLDNPQIEQDDYVVISWSGPARSGFHNVYAKVTDAPGNTITVSMKSGPYSAIEKGDSVVQTNDSMLLLDGNSTPYLGIYENISGYTDSPLDSNPDHSHLTTLLGDLSVVPGGVAGDLNPSGNGLFSTNAYLKGSIYADYFEGNSGNIAGLQMFEDSLVAGQTDEAVPQNMLEILTNNNPAIHLRSKSGVEELFIGGGFTGGEQSDTLFSRTDFGLSASRSVNAENSSSNPVDSASYGYNSYEVAVSGQVGRQVSFQMDYSLSGTINNTGGATPSDGDATASVHAIFKLLDSSGGELYSTTKVQAAANTGALFPGNTGTFTFIAQIPADTATIHVEYKIEAEVSPQPTPNGYTHGAVTAQVSFPDDPAIIITVKDYLSANGFGMIEQNTTAAYPKRISGNRNTGELLGRLLTVEGPAGHLAHFRMDSGGTLHLEDDSGAQKDSWPGF